MEDIQNELSVVCDFTPIECDNIGDILIESDYSCINFMRNRVTQREINDIPKFIYSEDEEYQRLLKQKRKAQQREEYRERQRAEGRIVKAHKRTCNLISYDEACLLADKRRIELRNQYMEEKKEEEDEDDLLDKFLVDVVHKDISDIMNYRTKIRTLNKPDLINIITALKYREQLAVKEIIELKKRVLKLTASLNKEKL